MDPIEVESEFSVSRVFRKVERGSFYLDESPSARGTAEDPKVFVAELAADFLRVTGYGLTEKQVESLRWMLTAATDKIWSRNKTATFFNQIVLSDIRPGTVAVHIDFGSAANWDCRNWSLLNYRQSLNIGKSGGYSTFVWNKKQKKSVLKTGNDLLLDYDFWGKK